MFGGGGAPPPLSEAPPPPPNPPQFGSNTTGTAQLRKQTAANSGYAGSIIGGAQAPASTGQKTLLGA